MTQTLIVVPLSQLPYPHGLGKGEHKALEHDLKRLLPEQLWWDSATHQHLLESQDETYLAILRRGLETFRNPDVVEVADTATRIAESLLAGGAPVTAQALHDRGAFADALAGESRYVCDWICNDPVVISGDSITNGRHRIAALRVYGTNPDMLVTVHRRQT